LNVIALTQTTHPLMESTSAAPLSVVAALTRSAWRKAMRRRSGNFTPRYFGRLFRYVLMLMRGDEQAALDVAQETLLARGAPRTPL
jgi:hypothetical protein